MEMRSTKLQSIEESKINTDYKKLLFRQFFPQGIPLE